MVAKLGSPFPYPKYFQIALPGIGKLLIDAIDSRDALVVQGIVTFAAIAYVVINFAIDMLYGVLDPRVQRRLSEA